jgi:hypothetical protein
MPTMIRGFPEASGKTAGLFVKIFFSIGSNPAKYFLQMSLLQNSAKAALALVEIVVFIRFGSHEITVPAIGGGGECLVRCF